VLKVRRHKYKVIITNNTFNGIIINNTVNGDWLAEQDHKHATNRLGLGLGLPRGSADSQ
jgi:hypothetical protein